MGLWAGLRLWCCLDTFFWVTIIGFTVCLLLRLRLVCCIVVFGLLNWLSPSL